MKLINIFIIALLLTLSAFGQQTENTAGSSVEKTILNEINEARTNPVAYAAYLEEYKLRMKGDYVVLPNGSKMKTFEGLKAVDEAISFLKNSPRLEPLASSDSLAKPAGQQVADLSENNNLGHTGKDGSGLGKRLAKFGFTGSIFAENLVMYIDNPREIVITMIIDDGISSRGDRKNIFNPKFRHVGLAFGNDKSGVALFIAVLTDSAPGKNNSTASLRMF